MNCKCGGKIAGFIGSIGLCINCFRKMYIPVGDTFLKRSDVVADEDGVLRQRQDVAECKDAITGAKFFSRKPSNILGLGKVSKATLDNLKGMHLLHTSKNGKTYYRPEFAIDEHGNIGQKGKIAQCTCSKCKKVYETFQTNYTQRDEAICYSCALASGIAKCRRCGNFMRASDTMSRSLLESGIDKLDFQICNTCVKLYLPFEYHAIREVKGLGRKIGLEVECEPTVDSQLSLALWGGFDHMVNGGTDGSLRGNFPCEFSSPILHESNYLEWLEEFHNRLKGRVYIRCGFHIHIGTEDLEWPQINNMMVNIKAREKELLSLVSPSRKTQEAIGGNNAGLPQLMPDTPKFSSRDQFMSFLYGSDYRNKNVGKNIKSSKRCNDRQVHYSGALNRYQWANIHGHFFKRAIEIRSHQGTVDTDKMQNWIELWLNLVPVLAMEPSKLNGKILDHVPKHLEAYYLAKREYYKKLSKEMKIRFE